MEHFQEISKTKVFSFIDEFECQSMMYCLKMRFKTFEKNQPIVEQGKPMQEILLILKGSANVSNSDLLGNISIFMQLKKGDVYGLESAYAGDEVYKDSVIAQEKTLVMFMNKHRAITPCENKCKRHEILSRLLMKEVAESSKALFEKLYHMSKKTIREKVSSYLSSLATKNNANYFDLPFNKTDLAAYLGVDRSAMSLELKKMKDEGLIDFDKRNFHLNDKFFKKN